MSVFSNQPVPLTDEERRQRYARAIADIDRQLALPAGHPEILRAMGCDDRAPVPAALWKYFEGLP